MNAICMVIDRLHAGYVGAYGNSWIETPAIDRMAAESFLFDQALVDTPQLETLYRSYWQGWHAMCPPPPESRAPIVTCTLEDARGRLAAKLDAAKIRITLGKNRLRVTPSVFNDRADIEHLLNTLAG